MENRILKILKNSYMYLFKIYFFHKKLLYYTLSKIINIMDLSIFFDIFKLIFNYGGIQYYH